METFVKHPFHEHGLILRELSGRVKRTCFICGEYDVEGSSYWCDDCDICAHSECVNLPLQIQHAFHSDHPIKLVLQADTRGLLSPEYCEICTLQINNVNYWNKFECAECSNHPRFCVRCVTLSLLLNDEEVEVPEHLPQHNHPLTHLDVTMRTVIECQVCNEFISGPVYGCRKCLFSMHASCAQLPKKMIQHPLHPQHPLTFSKQMKRLRCRACGESSGSNYNYCCESSECDNFNLHAPCAALALPPPDWKRETLISSTIHQHPLVSFPLGIRLRDILCALCSGSLPYSDEVYCCIDCSVLFHKQCAEIPQQLIHPLHPKHPLTLVSLSTGEEDHHICGHCEQWLWSGIYLEFQCECWFHLCFSCALHFLDDGDKVVSLDFHHFVHQHPLTRRPREGRYTTTGGVCTVCNYSGTLYECNTCDGFSIHKSCLKEVSEINHPFHPSHPLKRITLPKFSKEYMNERCSACFLEIWSEWGRVFFHCAECTFYLCYDCAYNKSPTINHRPHMHELTYFPKIHVSMEVLCNYCGIACTTDLYRCVDCNFNLHHDCATLPLTAIDEYHHHPLSLCDGAPGDYADKKEFNCSHCQCSRDPKLGIYACEQCHYYAHIHCIVPKERGKRKKVAETVYRIWDTKISIQEAKVEELLLQLNMAQEELEYLKIGKEQEIEDRAFRDDIDEL